MLKYILFQNFLATFDEKSGLQLWRVFVLALMPLAPACFSVASCPLMPQLLVRLLQLLGHHIDVVESTLHEIGNVITVACKIAVVTSKIADPAKKMPRHRLVFNTSTQIKFKVRPAQPRSRRCMIGREIVLPNRHRGMLLAFAYRASNSW